MNKCFCSEAKKPAIIFALFSLVCTILVLSGCLGIQEGARRGNLEFAVNDYNQSIRWGMIGRALAYIPQSNQEEFTKTAEKVFDNVSFADFEIRAILPDPEVTTAKVMINVGVYTKDSLKLVTVKQLQKWQKVNNKWYILNPDLEIFLKKLNSP